MEFDPNSNPPCYKTMDEVGGEAAHEREEGEMSPRRDFGFVGGGRGTGEEGGSISEYPIPSSLGHCDSARR